MRRYLLAVVLALLLSVSPAGAQPVDLETVSVNLEPVFLLAGGVVAALLGYFAVRKAIKLVNHS